LFSRFHDSHPAREAEFENCGPLVAQRTVALMRVMGRTSSLSGLAGARKCQFYSHFRVVPCMSVQEGSSPAEPLFIGI
jgi:hypothetical protein